MSHGSRGHRDGHVGRHSKPHRPGLARAVHAGGSDTAYLAWRYTTGTASGNVPFTIPGTITPGTYELRLWSNNGFTRLAISNSFTVQ